MTIIMKIQDCDDTINYIYHALIQGVQREYGELVKVVTSAGQTTFVHIMDVTTLNAIISISIKCDFTTVRLVITSVTGVLYSDSIPMFKLSELSSLNDEIMNTVRTYYFGRKRINVQREDKLRKYFND